ESRRLFDRVPAHAWQWKMRDTAAAAALVAAKHGFVDIAARVRPWVEVHRGMLVSFASVGGYVGTPFEFVLGMLDVLDGKHDAARAWFAEARSVAAKSTAPGIRALVERRISSLPDAVKP